MSTVFPSNDNNDTDLLYDDISEDAMKLSSTKKTFVGSGRNLRDWKEATNHNRQSMTADATTTTIAPSQATVAYDFMNMSTRSDSSLNTNNNESETFNQEYPSSSNTTTTPTPLLNSIELVPILQEQIRQLQNENRILKRNIGILYRTAKTEIQRKDQQLIQQQSQR